MATDFAALENITKEQWSELEMKVRAANGKVILLVHPFFRIGMERNKDYYKIIIKILKQTRTPVVVLEERTKFAKTRAKLEKLEAAGHLMIATGWDKGLPMLKRFGGDVKENWDIKHQELIMRLERAGAEKFFVAGRRTYPRHKLYKIDGTVRAIREYEKSRLPKKKPGNGVYSSEPFAAGCAGGLYGDLILFRKRAIWLPKAIDLEGLATSPYPAPSLRRKRVKATKPKRSRAK